MKEFQIRKVGPRFIPMKTEKVEFKTSAGEKVTYYKAVDAANELVKKDINEIIAEIETDINVETAKVTFVKFHPLEKDGLKVSYEIKVFMKESAQA